MRNADLLRLVATLGLAQAALTNITIDDSNSTFITFVGNGWNNQNANGFAQPDKAIAMMGTWHDTTRSGEATINDPRSFQISFDGVAVTMYCILFQTPTLGVTTQVNLTFTLDGLPAGSYINNMPLPMGATMTTYLYNVPTFSAQNLENKQHTLSAVIEWNSVVLVDYAVITLDPGVSTSSASSSTSLTSASPAPSHSSDDKSSKAATIGASVGATVGVVAFVACAVLFILFRRRRQRIERIDRQQATTEIEPHPFDPWSAAPPAGLGGAGDYHPGQIQPAAPITERPSSYGFPAYGLSTPSSSTAAYVGREGEYTPYGLHQGGEKRAIASSSRMSLGQIPQVELDAGSVPLTQAGLTLPPPYVDRRVNI